MPTSPNRWEHSLPRALPAAWAHAAPRDMGDRLAALGKRLDGREEPIVPEPERVFRALSVDPDRVRVVIIGQDPYPNPSHASGLAFSIPRGVSPLPPSAKNIRTELHSDLGLPVGQHLDLDSWAQQGVLLLNRHLTTAAGQPAAHTDLGWSEITNWLIDRVVDASPQAVAILWGQHARRLAGRMGPLGVIESAHPSPLSAHRGFFGSQPFSRANALLSERGVSAIDWRLP